MGFLIGVVVFIAFLIIRGNYISSQQEEEYRRKKRIDEAHERKVAYEEAKELRKRKEEERKREEELSRIDRLYNQTVVVVYEGKSANGRFMAILKHPRGRYCSVERNSRFRISEEVKIAHKDLGNYNWYDEIEYQKQLTIKRNADLVLKKEQEKQKEQERHLNKYGIDYLYHMTHKDNLTRILENGLKSHNYARNNFLLQNDIADNDVNDRRIRPESIYRRSVHDYVPLYFNPKNPMLYVRKDIQNEIVILAIDRKLLYQENVVFTDGNAAAATTSFYKKIEDLERLDWNCIYAEYWNDFVDGKRLRCSEVLVYPEIPVKAIQKIFCSNIYTQRFISSRLNNLSHIEAEINYDLYF